MASIQIIVGSMMGATEYVAEACAETLLQLGHQVTVHLQPAFEQLPHDNQLWLICTATHGAGDYPDNIQPFVLDLENYANDLSTIKFLTLGVGDSSYDTFCFAAKKIENILITKACKKLAPIYTLDMSQDIDPESMAQAWIKAQQDLL